MTKPSKSTLLSLADAFLDLKPGLREVTLSYWVFGDTKKLAGLRGDADITVSRFNAAMTWFAGNWPDSSARPDVLGAYVEAPSPSIPSEDAA